MIVSFHLSVAYFLVSSLYHTSRTQFLSCNLHHATTAQSMMAPTCKFCAYRILEDCLCKKSAGFLSIRARH